MPRPGSRPVPRDRNCPQPLARPSRELLREEASSPPLARLSALASRVLGLAPGSLSSAVRDWGRADCFQLLAALNSVAMSDLGEDTWPGEPRGAPTAALQLAASPRGPSQRPRRRHRGAARPSLALPSLLYLRPFDK